MSSNANQKVIDVTLCWGRWTFRHKNRMDAAVLRIKSSCGWMYPIRTTSYQVNSRCVRIFCEQYEHEMLKRLMELQQDISFPRFTIKCRSIKGFA